MAMVKTLKLTGLFGVCPFCKNESNEWFVPFSYCPSCGKIWVSKYYLTMALKDRWKFRSIPSEFCLIIDMNNYEIYVKGLSRKGKGLIAVDKS